MISNKIQNISTLEFKDANLEQKQWAQASVEKFREMGCLYEPGRYSPTPLCFSKMAFESMLDDVKTILTLARKVAFDSGNALRWARNDQRDLVEKWMTRTLLPVMARPDGIIVDGNLKLLELNIDSGLGGYFEVELVQNRLAEFNHRFLGNEFTVPTVMSSICEYLENLAVPLAKSKWKVAVMIDSHLTAYNSSHAHMFTEYLNQNIPAAFAKVVHSEDVYRDGAKLRDKEDVFDIIWRFGSMAHSPQALAVSIAIQSIALDADVIMVSNPADVGVEGKLVLAFLSHHADSDSSILSAEERQLVQRLIPWTRIVDRGETLYRGKSLNLEQLALTHRSELVLKRSHSKSALQVYIGAEMTDEDWRSRISEALEDEVSWVIQQNVKSDKLQFDYIGTDGTITSLYQSYSVNPFIFGDAYAAPFIRVERDDNNRRLAIANVSAMAICGVMINPLP